MLDPFIFDPSDRCDVGATPQGGQPGSIVGTLNQVAPEEVGLSSVALDRLSERLRDAVDARQLPGAVILVARHGKLARFEALGTLNPASGAPMRRDAIFRIYSMTKPIVSMAAMMLVEQDKLHLDQRVADYLPEYAAQHVAGLGPETAGMSGTRRQATVRDLLRHTAGLTYEFLGSSAVQREYAQARIGSGQRSSAEFSRLLAALPLICEPGTVWEYSRATDVLGRLIEVISGTSLGTHLSETILQPLGMVDTGFSVPSEDFDRIAEPFARDPSGGLSMRLIDVRKACVFESGGGGLVSTAFDYARFLQCLLGNGEFAGKRLLQAATVCAMTTDQLGPIPIHGGGSRDLLPQGYGYGLGFAVCKETGVGALPDSLGAYYWGGMAGTSFFVDPARDMFACLMLLAPNQREHYRQLFCQGVYDALLP